MIKYYKINTFVPILKHFCGRKVIPNGQITITNNNETFNKIPANSEKQKYFKGEHAGFCAEFSEKAEQLKIILHGDDKNGGLTFWPDGV